MTRVLFIGFSVEGWRRPESGARVQRDALLRETAPRVNRNFFARRTASEGAAHLGAPGRGDGAPDGGAHLGVVPVLALPDGAVGVLDAVDDDALGEGVGRVLGEALGADGAGRA